MISNIIKWIDHKLIHHKDDIKKLDLSRLPDREGSIKDVANRLGGIEDNKHIVENHSSPLAVHHKIDVDEEVIYKVLKERER